MNNIYNNFYETRRRYDELKNTYNPKLARDLYEIEKIESINPEELIDLFKYIKIDLWNLVGLCLESFFVCRCNEDRYILNRAFRIATNNPRASQFNSDKYIAIGTGLRCTKMNYLDHYSKNDPNNDVKFLKYNNGKLQVAMTSDKSVYAGIQLKAITCHERSEIINPILNNVYKNVITFLRNRKTGIHTKDICYQIIDDMKEYRKYYVGDSKFNMNKETRNHLKNSIYAPEDLGISQVEIDEYVEYICYCYYNGKFEVFLNFEMYMKNGITLLMHALNHYRLRVQVELQSQI